MVVSIFSIFSIRFRDGVLFMRFWLGNQFVSKQIPKSCSARQNYTFEYKWIYISSLFYMKEKISDTVKQYFFINYCKIGINFLFISGFGSEFEFISNNKFGFRLDIIWPAPKCDVDNNTGLPWKHYSKNNPFKAGFYFVKYSCIYFVSTAKENVK